jgi:N-acetylglucosaminyl-diphospho-decaprenol L-rhamnosyltransferase
LLVSVIIPVYNGSQVIIPCLEAVFNSKGEHALEVIVVEDSSTDDSLQILESCNFDIHLLKNDRNYGYTYAVNRGLKACHGDAIMLLNQDTEIAADTVPILCQKLISDLQIGAIAPRLVNPDGSLQKSVRRFPTHLDIIYHHLGLAYIFPDSPVFNRWKMADFDHLEERFVDQPAFSAIMIKREVINSVGLLDQGFPLYFNDVDYSKRMIDAGWKIMFCPEAVVRHQRGQATGQRKIRSVYLSHAAFIRYLYKYYKSPNYVIPNFICSFLLIVSAHIRAIYYFFRGIISKA